MVGHQQGLRGFSEEGPVMKNRTGLLTRYMRFLGLTDRAELTESMVLRHWDLETRLARRILQSTREGRSETIRSSYEIFYRELKWLNDPHLLKGLPPVSRREAPVIRLIGKKPKRIFEIGSGNGALIDYLSRQGHECVGSDIDRERFKVHANPHLVLNVRDGAAFSPKVRDGDFDVVLSSNVLEHIHPEDVEGHFNEVHRMLAGGGEYILKTPHRLFGPHGIERVFGITRNLGLHLKEYTYLDIEGFSRRSGFTRCRAVFQPPRHLAAALKRLGLDVVWPGRFYMQYLMLIERLILSFLNERSRRRAAVFFRFILLPRQVFVVVEKQRTSFQSEAGG
jgi:SAM-dependent methyltransferase